MLSLQEISDRLEIQDLLARYSYAIDERDWDALDDVFTPDAAIDYSETGGAKGGVAQIKAWLPVALERFPRYQHMVATTKLRLDGDSATSRTCLFNPMVYKMADGMEQVFFIGLWYRAGWCGRRRAGALPNVTRKWAMRTMCPTCRPSRRSRI